MEVKKTDKASLRGNNMLYFLGGLNLVLALVLAAFYYQSMPEKVEIVEPPEIVETSEVVLIEIPEPETPPPPPAADEPPPPPPPPVPEEIIQSPEPVEPPPLKVVDDTPPPIVTTPAKSTKAPGKIDLSKLQGEVKKAPKEERVTKPVSPNRVQDMAVYPGCEKYRGNKRKLTECFGDELGKDILDYLNQEFPDRVDKPFVKVQLEFHVSTNGELVNITPKAGDEEFKDDARRALEKVAAKLKRKGQLIEPARMANGDKAILLFQNIVTLKNPKY